MSRPGTRIYLTGADGMLGRALTAVLAEGGYETCGVSIHDFDIADADAVSASIREFKPDVVVHTAANAIVDECETQPALAMRVNVEGTRNVVAACRDTSSRLVLISSDYVFDGRDGGPDGYRENDLPAPLNVYGLTKVAGERLASLVERHLVVRTSWLFGGRDVRTDQLLAMVRAARRGDPNELISDQFGSPTYAVDLALALRYLVCAVPDLTGVLHVANTGAASWYEVGEVALEQLRAQGALPAGGPPPARVSVHSRGFVGARPGCSSLNIDRLTGLGWRMPPWQDAVRRFCAVLVEQGEV